LICPSFNVVLSVPAPLPTVLTRFQVPLLTIRFWKLKKRAPSIVVTVPVAPDPVPVAAFCSTRRLVRLPVPPLTVPAPARLMPMSTSAVSTPIPVLSTLDPETAV